MESLRSVSIYRLLILSLGMLLGSSSAHGQGYAAGKFTLAHETNWGTAVLSPGDYRFSLETTSLPAMLVLRKADGTLVGLILAQSSTVTGTRSDESSLQLEVNGNQRFVSSLYLNDLGMTLHYATRAISKPPETAKLQGPALSGANK
jgi:hypothetical protein